MQHHLSLDAYLEAVRALYAMLSPCRICPRRCGAKRAEGQRGLCGADDRVELASATVHRGEEPPISGAEGSGTLFFSHCALNCIYCQNWPISQQGVGRPLTIEELAERMLSLQKSGVHNINLVNPTHYWPLIAAAAFVARQRGLTIPLLANTSGYENLETLAKLDGIVQIWLPDLKYADREPARRFSGRDDLPAVNRRAVGYLCRKYGPLRLDDTGMAASGVLIRHLVLPGQIAQSRKVLRLVSRRLGRRIPVSLMTQYFPAYKAHDDPELNRPLTRTEKRRVWRAARRFGIRQGWRQQDG